MYFPDAYFQTSRRVAEYFVICGLPENPKPYDLTKVLTHSEEIVIPDKPVDFTAFPEPIVDIQFVCLKDRATVPPGYHAIRRSASGKYKANIRGRIGDEVYLCYRRGRDQPPITNISMFTEHPTHKLKQDAYTIPRTMEGKKADLGNALLHPTYLSYTRASSVSGIDQLAVVDMCIILPDKQECCPPAFNQLSESLNSNPLGTKLYLCFRKSLIKEHTIAYEPEVLFCYRVPQIPSEFNCVPTEEPPTGVESSTKELVKPEQTSLDQDICQVANFCLPWGASLESWSVDQDHPQPNHFTFVLTNEVYQRLYGVAFTFHEPYDISKLDKDQCYRLGADPELLFPSPGSTTVVHTVDELDPEEKAKITARQKHFLRSRIGDRVIGVTKTICILSRWSFPVAFTNFLAFIYSRCFPGVKNDSVPLERYLTHFLCEVPFPDQKMPNILVELCAAPILLQLPGPSNASSNSEPFFHLLSQLGVDLSIELLVQMLTEQKVLLTSVQHFLLTQIGEALTSMIFPLQWAVVYIPFIYMGHVQVIQSPFPYLIGVDSRFFDFFRLPHGGEGITYVDLDTKNFQPAECPGQATVLTAKMLPRKPMKELRARLNALSREIHVLRQQQRPKEPVNYMFKCLFSEPGSELAKSELITLRIRTEIGERVREAFALFMASLLKDYRKYLIPVRLAERDMLFDGEAFLEEAADEKSQLFYSTLFQTQQWVNFVRDRSYTSPREEELTNFDSLIARLWGERHAYSASRVASNWSVSSSSSIRRSEDNSSADLSLLPGLSTTRDNPDESVVFKLLSNGQTTSASTHTIGPPTWPVPIGDFGPVESIKAAAQSGKISLPPCPFDLVPVNLNTRLMNRLASYGYHQQIAALNEALGLNSIDSTCGLSTLTAAEPQLLAGSSAATNRPIYSLTSRYFCILDNPSPLVPRSGSKPTLGLTGLPTKYPLPIGSSLILRRSPLEVRHTVEFCKRAINEYSMPWAKQLVGTMYSLWFMLFPAYLASLHVYTSERQEQPGEQDSAMAAVNQCLTDAVQLADRLANYNIGGPDQVVERILLVLIYQNRPPNISLPDYLEKIDWNDASMGLVNHIFKMYEKECLELQRLERLRAHQHPSRQNIGTNRRSASISYSTGALETVQSEPTFTGFNPTLHGDEGDAVTAKPTDIQGKDREAYMLHKRSSSSTAACFAFLANSSVQPAKSETDSGLLLVAGNGEEPPSDDPGGVGSQEEAEPEDAPEPTIQTLEAPIKCLSIAAGPAPLASSDDLTDLGYSTLQRLSTFPGEQNENLALNPPDSRETASVHDSVEPSNLRSSRTPPHGQTLQAPSNGFLEPLQKPPQSTWFESAPPPSSEIRPTHSADGRKHIVVTQERRKLKAEESLDSKSSESEEESVSPTSPSNTGDSQPNRPTHLRLSTSERTTMCYPFSPSNPTPSAPTSQNHSSSATSTMQYTNGAEQKPRGSLDYLNDVFTSLGKSDLTSKVVDSFRGWFSPSQKTASTTENTPQSNRRVLLSGLNIFSSPNTDKLPRNMRRWQLKNPGSSSHNGEQYDGEHMDDPNEQRINMTAHSQAQLHGDALAALQFHRELWYCVGGNLVVGTPYQRLYPATLPTYLSRRPAHFGSSHNRVGQSPMIGTHGLIRPNRSPSSNPDICGSTIPNKKPSGRSLSPDGRTSTEPNLATLPASEVTQLHIFLTTCNACQSCKNFVHDEEIMAAWSADEDEFNIRCPFCGQTFVPQITIRVLGELSQMSPPPVGEPSAVGDFRAQKPSSDGLRNESIPNSPERTSSSSMKGLMEFTHSYVSPLVLRKTLESVLQREGDECFRLVHTPKHTLLYRHERLLWNLVWYTHRLGLPTHLLDAFPMWLMDRQAEQHFRLSTGASLSGGDPQTTNKLPDALLQVKLAADLPVRISLRWNAYQSARSMANKPLYKQWLRRKSEYRSHCMLIQGNPALDPIISPSNLNLSASSSCPVEATMARVVDAIRQSNMFYAFDSLVQFRASIIHQKPMSTVIRNQSPHRSAERTSAAAPLTGEGSVPPSDQKQLNEVRSECTDTHRCAWCLEGSLYRELLFLTITALPPAYIDLVQFDDSYNNFYVQYLSQRNPMVHDTDRPPSYVAAACRQMLRSLTLVP